jgi:hypothetical protein
LIYHDARVQQLSAVEQDLRAFPPTEWVWAVEPLKSGSSEAFLRVTILREMTSSQKGMSFVYPLTIEADSNLIKSSAEFIFTSWQWIFGTILIPLVLYGFHHFSSKRGAAVPVQKPNVRTRQKRKRQVDR